MFLPSSGFAKTLQAPDECVRETEGEVEGVCAGEQEGIVEVEEVTNSSFRGLGFLGNHFWVCSSILR